MAKILIIPSWYPTEEDKLAGVFVQEQADALQDQGQQISIFFSNLMFIKRIHQFSKKPVLKKRKNTSIPTYIVDGFSLPKRSLFLMDLWAEKQIVLFNQYIELEGKPDLIHAHSFIGGYLAMKFAKKHQIPYIITEHHMEFLKTKINSRFLSISKPVFENAIKVIGVSKALSEKLSIISNTEAILIPNSIDENIFFSKKKKHIINSIDLLCVANFEHNKNIEKLLESFKILLQTLKHNYKYNLTIVGDGPIKSELHNCAKKYNINTHISWIDYLDRTAIGNRMRESDIFILPSDFETFGTVLIESIACGTPVICTSAGGPKDIITNENGVYLLNGNSEELADEILRMTEKIDTFDSAAMSKNIHRIYGSAPIAKITIDVYNKILNN